jgi:hypothetical protein
MSHLQSIRTLGHNDESWDVSAHFATWLLLLQESRHRIGESGEVEFRVAMYPEHATRHRLSQRKET